MSGACRRFEHMFDPRDEPGAASSRCCVPGSLEVLAQRPPSPQVLGDLALIDRSSLCEACAVTYAAAMDRVIGWCTALQDEALAAAGGLEPKVETFQAGSGQVVVADLIVEEIAAALRWSSSFAASRLAQARLLAGPLAATAEAVRTGRISHAHARVIVAASERLPSMNDPSCAGLAQFAAQCADLQQSVLPIAARGTVAQARRSADRAVVRIDARSRREVARSGLGVRVVDDGAGICTLIARMRAVHAAACMAAIDRLADDPRLEVPADATIGERQAIALASLVLPLEPLEGKAGSRRPHLSSHLDVTVSLETLLGVSDEPAEFRARRGLAGALDNWALREMLAQSDEITLRRLVTDPVTGHLLDRGRHSYRVPESLRRFLVARDRFCRFPGCCRRASGGEIDHAFPWSDGGATDRGNLGVLCKRHHLAKTFGGWRIEYRRPDGVCTWNSPQGRRSDHPPVAIGIARDVISGRPPPWAGST